MNDWYLQKFNSQLLTKLFFLIFSTWWNTQPRINSTSESVFILTMFWGSTKCCRAQALIVCKLEWEVPSASPRLVILCYRSYILRPQNFAKSPPYIWPLLHRTHLRWRFHKTLWPSQNINQIVVCIIAFLNNWWKPTLKPNIVVIYVSKLYIIRFACFHFHYGQICPILYKHNEGSFYISRLKMKDIDRFKIICRN